MSQNRIVRNWDRIICNQPANSGPDPHSMQLRMIAWRCKQSYAVLIEDGTKPSTRSLTFDKP